MSYAPRDTAPKPDYDNLQQEPTGPIASDSLAAESLESGGGFADNDNAEALGVKGANSTLNTTDTSGATALHSAPDGTTRAREDYQALGSDERGHTGVKYPDAGAGSAETTNTYSGGTGDSFAPGALSSESNSGPDPNIRSGTDASRSSRTANENDSYSNEPIATGGAGDAFGTSTRPSGSSDAPNYAGVVSGAIGREGDQRPKGDNLTEGDLPETKTFTGDVGGPHDPGRLAEKNFQGQGSGNIVSAGEKQDTGDAGGSTGAYDVLSSEKLQ